MIRELMQNETAPRLVPIERTGKKRELGYDKGLPFHIATDFDTFVPAEFNEYVE